MTRKVSISTILLTSFLTIAFLTLAFLFLNKQVAFGYKCPAGTSCSSVGSITEQVFRRKCDSWTPTDPPTCVQYGCYSSNRIEYSCSGTDNDCTGQSETYYISHDNCMNGYDPLHSYCCNSGSGGGEENECGCGTQECESTDCECTYIGCKRISDPEENCYVHKCDSPVPCIDCNLGNCPAPLTNRGSEAYKLSNYRSCMRGGSCAGMKYGDCFEVPSVQPTSSLQILPSGDATRLGCTSSTHTGVEVNSIIRIESTHTDPNGANDIEALYVWLKTGSTIPATPQYIDSDNSSRQEGRTYTRNSYGFMMHKEGANWVPYIPSQVGGGNDKWVRANYSGGRFAIKGTSSRDMVYVQINGVVSSGNSITLNFHLDFRNISVANRVQEGTYNIFVMANDVFGFTPYDNYGPGVKKIGDYFFPEQIRFYRNWTDSLRDWIKDFTRPHVNTSPGEVTGPRRIKFNWNIGDLRSLFALVGNIYVSDGVTQSDNITNVVLISPGSRTVVSPYLPQQQGSSIIGDMRGSYLAKSVGIRGISSNGNLEMSIGGNREGSLIFYLTAFDSACNYNQSYSMYNVEDWIITYGGLVYSSTGVDFAVRKVGEGTWGAVNLLNRIRPSFADISSEMYGNALSNPSALSKSNITRSFSISPFTGYRPVDFYQDIKNTFERREVGIEGLTRLNPNTASLIGSLGGGTIKVLDRNGNLSVGDANPFICDGKGMFFVNGDLTINNRILNSNYNRDACIFVVSGDVIINQGANSSGGLIGYDEINAYILTNGSVTVSTDVNFDGLYISGGIKSLGGIDIDRYLGLNYRDTHPLFVVNHHSKYGILSGVLIGNPIDMVKVEVGFKPF